MSPRLFLLALVPFAAASECDGDVCPETAGTQLLQKGSVEARAVVEERDADVVRVPADEPSLQACVDRWDGAVHTEDNPLVCRLAAGRYTKSALVEGKSHIHILGEEGAVFDGTRAVDAPSEAWDEDEKGVFSTTVEFPVAQLFLGEDMLVPARWPNAQWKDKTMFMNTHWGKVTKESTRGQVLLQGKSEQTKVAASQVFDLCQNPPCFGEIVSDRLLPENVNLTGAAAILNIGSWDTFTYRVAAQTGPKSFTWSDVIQRQIAWDAHGNFYLEKCPELLDEVNEWCYNGDTGRLYFKPEEDAHDWQSRLLAKREEARYLLELADSSHVTIEGIRFFGTTIKTDKARNKFWPGLRFINLEFVYATSNKRMLGDDSFVTGPALAVNGGAHRKNTVPILFSNCSFQYSDGNALEFQGHESTVENCLFEYNDWTGSTGGGYLQGYAGTINAGFSKGARFVRNTLRNNGPSTGVLAGFGNVFDRNVIEGQCFGTIQGDGCGVQVAPHRQPDTVFRQNWVHSSPKYALRFDGQPRRLDSQEGVGIGGTMDYNAVWHCGGLMAKGEEKTLTGNLAFGHRENGNDDQQSSGGACNICVLRYVRSNPVRCNIRSLSVGNIGRINGGATPGPNACKNHTDKKTGELKKLGWHGYDPDVEDSNEWCPTKYPLTAADCTDPATCIIAGKKHKATTLFSIQGHGNVHTYERIRDFLRDVDARDFRPRSFDGTTETTAGPYGQAFYEAQSANGDGDQHAYHYWIPGRVGSQASMPVPYDGAPKVLPTTDLIFLPAQGCESSRHIVYVGNSTEQWEIGQLLPGANIFVQTNEDFFRSHKKYYWRVDCVSGPPGPLWDFTVCGAWGDWKRDVAHSKMSQTDNPPSVAGEDAVC